MTARRGRLRMKSTISSRLTTKEGRTIPSSLPFFFLGKSTPDNLIAAFLSYISYTSLCLSMRTASNDSINSLFTSFLLYYLLKLPLLSFFISFCHFDSTLRPCCPQSPSSVSLWQRHVFLPSICCNSQLKSMYRCTPPSLMFHSVLPYS